jgi:basic membrane protein A and related proteins
MKNRFWRITVLLVLAVLLITGCAGQPAPAPAANPSNEADFSFALVTPNPRGDRSFIDAAARGAEQAMSSLPVRGSIIEARGVAEQESAIRGAINQNNDLVLTLAPEPEIILKLAEEFPDQRFGVPSDIFVEELPDNVAAFQINVHEGSFLAGVVAGMLTETNTVGAVVGGDAPGLNQFYWAYRQGVLEVCPDCQVLVSYLGFDFANPTLGKETALSQYDQGADIIFQIAGRSGEGVLSAARERGRYAIGVDSNQDDIAPGNVIVSMMKRVDTTTMLLVQNALEDNFHGGFSVIGMPEGGTGLSWDEGSTTFEENGPEAMTSRLAEVKEQVESYRAQILDGSLEVCDALNPTAACEGIN